MGLTVAHMMVWFGGAWWVEIDFKTYLNIIILGEVYSQKWGPWRTSSVFVSVAPEAYSAVIPSVTSNTIIPQVLSRGHTTGKCLTEKILWEKIAFIASPSRICDTALCINRQLILCYGFTVYLYLYEAPVTFDSLFDFRTYQCFFNQNLTSCSKNSWKFIYYF